MDDLVWLLCLGMLAWTLWLGFTGQYAGMLFIGVMTLVAMGLIVDKRDGND
jgi:hypothetical protein